MKTILIFLLLTFVVLVAQARVTQKVSSSPSPASVVVNKQPLHPKSYAVTVVKKEHHHKRHHFSVHSIADTSEATLAQLPQQLSVKLNVSESAIRVCAWGTHDDQINEVGWSFLDVHTNQSCSDHQQAFAAGYLEGAATWKRSWQNYKNTIGDLGKKTVAFIKNQLKWVRKQAKSKPSDPFWYQVGLTIEQLDGLYKGYRRRSPKKYRLTEFQLYAMTMSFELDDIQTAVGESTDDDSFIQGDHCSALVKLLPGNSELYFSHNTWSSLETMLRSYKLYDFPFKTKKGSSHTVPAVNISFSSYPGTLFSGDDFYLTSAGLAVQETTNDVYDDARVKKYVVPHTVPEWARNMVACRLARGGEEWTKIFARHNSGTYNNQWMVLDYKLFTPGSPLVNNTLWIIEQMPGYTESADVTEILSSQTYWASYNIPYFPKVFHIAAYDIMQKQYGDEYSYQRCARANIFRRDHVNVVDPTSFRVIMRYNDYTHDPFSQCDCTPPYTACNAIAARGDLNPKNGTYYDDGLGHVDMVAIDGKMTSHALFTSGLHALAISGPTYDQQPVFVWSNSSFKHLPHLGQPDAFNFPWVDVSF